MTCPEHLESTVMLDSIVPLQESNEVTSMQRGKDWDSVNEMSRLCDTNRELSEELCKCRDLCDKQVSEMVLMQTALREAVEQASTARQELEAYRHEKVCVVSDLEGRLSASRDECSALRDEMCRLEKSMEERCNTVLAIANRDWESRVNEIVSERDTAMKELSELRGRLDMADDVDARLVKAVCRSDMRTEMPDRIIEHDVALSSGFTSDLRETVSVGVGKDAEDDESNCMVVDGWSDYSSECIHDEHKPSVSVGSPTRLVSVETQATDSVSWLATDTLSTSGFTYPSTVDQSTMSAVEMTREKLVSSSLCEDKSNVVGQLREELASCYEQIVKLSKSVEESDASLMDVRRLLTVKESEVADLREEKRHLRDEVNELRETVEAERRDLDIMRANVDVLERKEEVSAMYVESRGPNTAAVEEECVQTEIEDDVYDLVSSLQVEVAHLREENAATLTALERSQLELMMKQTEVQELESRIVVNERTWSIPCETVRKAPDVVVGELAEVDDTDRVEADVFSGVPDKKLVETVAGDSVSGIVHDRMDRQTMDLCVEGVSNEEVVSPIHATQSWTKPTSEEDNDDPELSLLNTDSLRARLKEAMNRISELENAKTELSARVGELEGVMMCEEKPMDVMPLSSGVPDRSMKVTDEADALSKQNKELMTEVDLLRSRISERVTMLDDVCMEMDEVRGSLGFLLKQVKELRAAHAEANADRADMANRVSEYERASRRPCETVGRSTSPVQDIDYAHEGLSTDRCTSDGLREDLQRALDTQSFELEVVTEKLKECESVNNDLICECESLKRRLESYVTVTSDLENDVTKTKALLVFVVDHIRGLRSDYGDWCREHEERVHDCLDAVATGLSHGVVEHVDRECETMTCPEHLESTVMLDSIVPLQESNEVTSMQRGKDWDSVNEMSRLCDTNRELSEELCKCRDLCDKQVSEMVLMQTALREAVEQASTARQELEAYRHEKVCVVSDLEGRLSASRDECSALRDEMCRLEKSMEERCNTVLAIANRDWESRVNEIVSERDTAMKELSELRGRLDMADDVDARLVKAVCRSDMRTEMPDRIIEHDVALSSGFTSDLRETVSVGVGKDAEDDESNCMVVDGWSDYSSECIHDEHKPSVSVGSPTRLVSVETQATDSVSWLATDTLSTSGFTYPSTVDQSTMSAVEMTREKLVSSSLCEDKLNVVGQLREELASCYEQIVKLSKSVEESDASLMDVRRLLTVKESEVADLREEKRHLRDEVNELRETVEAERRDLDIMRANVDVLERKEEVSAMYVESRGPNTAAVEEECVQTEIEDDVYDLVSSLQVEVAHLREENAATLTALERSQLELMMKQTEVQELESRIVVNERTWSIPCETVRKAPDVVVGELAEVDDTDRVEADVFSGVPDKKLVETVAGDSVSGIVHDRMDRQTMDLCVEGVSNEEVVSPIHATQSWTKPTSEEDNDDPELSLLNTDSLRARLKEAMNRISELENAKTELSARVGELEGVMMCEEKPMDVMPLSSGVPDRSMKVTDEADALSKQNKELMTEVDLLRSRISERVTMLDDVCMEMDEVRGSLGFLLKQVKELRAAHAEANADRADMANRVSEYERASRRLCETVGRSTSPVQDIDYAHEGLSTDRCTSDGLREDLQRALDTQSFELEVVTVKLKECESVNNDLICECESLKRRLESYVTVTSDLENDVTKTKALLVFVVDHIRGLRSDYGDWCREHEERVHDCLDAVATGLSHGVVEHVDRECETMTCPEHLESTVMLDSIVPLQESNEVTSMQRGKDWDSVNEMSRLCDTNRELSEELCKCRDLCDKQVSEMVLMQTALREAVEQASTARQELEAYRHEKVCVVSDLEGRLSASRDECSALRDEMCRLEKSMEERCNTVLAIANRDWESRVNEIVSERDTAMKELSELRGRLDMADDVDARLVKAVCRSDMRTEMPDRIIEHDVALSSGFTSDLRETVSVGVGKDAEDDESNCMVVDGWSDYSSECIHDEHKPSVSVGSPTRLVSVETQATDSVSWLATDTLSTSGFTYPSTVDQSTMSAVEMTREKLVSSSLCEDKLNVVGQLREELASCYEQIVKLSKSVEESDASLMDVRRLLTVKESEVADLREEKRHLRDEVNELRETVEAERRDLDIMRANVDVLERKEEVSAMYVESRGPNTAAVEEECVQTEIEDDVYDLVSSLQVEVAHLREENAATLTALERSQLELMMKQTEVQELESRIVVNERTWSIPCETVRKAPDVVVGELAEVDDTDRVEADVFSGVPDKKLVETVAGDSVSGIVHDRMDRQTMDLCVEGVSNEEVVSPIHATQSWTKPTSEEDNDDPELSLLNTDSLRARLKEAMNRISELENAKTELSARVGELEGVMMCEEKPMDVMPLSSGVPDRSMKVTDEADALSKQNKELMTEVDLLRSRISERVTMLDDVCMEMDEVRGSLGFLLKQVKELRAAHAEANADRADMANRVSEYERASRRLCETVGRSTSPVQDIDYAHEGLSTDRCTSDGLREDLQRALDTQSFELEVVTEKLKECESVNNDLICECESLKRRLESYVTVTSDLENDVTKTKALLVFVVDHIRGLRSDYGDWCREHEERVHDCLDAVATGLSHGVVEHVDRECETMTCPEHLESTVMLDSIVPLQESNEVTSMQRGKDWDSVNEMSRLCDTNRELSEELCKCRDLCDKQVSEMVLMQTALREAVEQASTARQELEAYRHEKVCVVSDLEGRLSASRDECSALRDEMCRLEKSMEERCNTVLAIANRDWESRVNEIVSERDTAMKELSELRGRLDMADDVDARLVKAVCRSGMRTEMPDRIIEHDVALSSGFTSDLRETVSVGVGKDAEDDESNCMVVDGWSDYSSECIHDEHKPSVSVGSPTRLVSVETQATDSVSWLATDTLSTSGFTYPSTVDQSTMSAVEMTREKLVSSSLCEDKLNVVGQLREELASCYEQIVKLSKSVEESDASLMDVRRLLTVKESEVADLREEKRHLRDEVNELRETVEAERRDLDIMRANVDVLERKEEVSAMYVESRGPNTAAVEEECVQTEIEDDVYDLVSSLQVEVAHLREENAATLTALERSQLELMMKQTEVQELESRIVVNERTWSIPCETVRKAPDVVVGELAEVDDTDRVEADVFSGVPDKKLVETVAGDSVSGIVHDRMDRQTMDLCVEGVSNEEVVSPIHATQSWTKPTSEEDNDDPELSLLNTDSLRARLKEAMNRISELENAKTELSARVGELEGVMMCEEKPMDVMPLSSGVPDRSMKVTDEADALSKQNKELMTEVDLLRSRISERVTMLDDVCMEMDEVRGSLGFLLKQVKELRAAHAEANADRADMANRVSEYERASRRPCETVGRSTSPVQDIDYAHEGLSTDRCTSDGLREDLQRALDTQSFELEVVTEKLKECESVNNDLICECESLKRRLESYVTVTSDLENDVTKTKALLVFVVDHIRGLRSDYGDWCREHEERVHDCLDAVATGLSHGVVEHVDRECETMTCPEHLESTVMLDSIVPLQESNEVTSMQRGKDWDSVNEMSKLCDINRQLICEIFPRTPLSGEFCFCRNSTLDFVSSSNVVDELSQLKHNFSSLSMSLAFAVDFVDLCVKLVSLFVNLFLNLSRCATATFDDVLRTDFIDLLSDIVTFSKSSNFVEVFGDYSNHLKCFSNLYDLLLSPGLASCSLCKIQNVSDPSFICNLCVRCITSIQNPDVYNFMLNAEYPEINPMNGSTDDVVDDEDVNSPCDLISDLTPYTHHSQLVTQQSLPIDTQQSELEHKLIIAKSEMNRLYDLLYNIRSNNHNEQERDQDQLLSISTINLNLQRFIDGLFKEILQSLNESTSSSSSSSISCLTDCIHKYVMLNNQLITFPKNQYITNYYKHLNQFMNFSHLNHKPIINNNQFNDSQIEIQKIYFENLYLKKQNDQIFNDMNQQFSMIKLLINKSISNQILNTFFEKSITNSFIMNHHFNQYYQFIDYILNERSQLLNENLYYKNYINNNNESHLIDIENIDNNDKDDLDHFIKQQLDQFNHSILKTNQYLLNKINKINLKIENIENQLNNNQKYFNQKLINLQKINNQWKNNINLMFNHLFNLMNKINYDDDVTTTMATTEKMTVAAASTTVTTDQIQTHDSEISIIEENFNITEQSLLNVTTTTMTTATTTTVTSTTIPATDIPLSIYHLNESPINILNPNDIMPTYNLLMNQLQPQLNKMGMIENQLNSYNILIKQLIKQSNKLNNEIIQLQSLINNQNNETMIIDHLVTDNVAIATEPIEENDHDDNVTIATESTEVDNHDDDNTNIEMIMEKMKTYTNQLNCIRKKLIQIKQEKSNLLYHQMNEKPSELLNIEQMETYNEDTNHVDYELVVEEEEDIHRCDQSTSLNKKIDHVECINEQCQKQLSPIKEDISTIKTMILHIKEYMNRNLQHTFIYTSMDLHQALELDKSDDLLCNKLKMFSKFTHNLYELLQLYTVLSVPEVSSVEVCSEDDIVTFLDTLLSSIKNILERNDTKNSNIPIIDSTHQCIDSLEQQTTNQRTDEMISSLNEIPITTEVQLIRDQLQSHDPEVRTVEETINVTEQSLLNVRRDCTEFKDDERSVRNSTPDDSNILRRSNKKLLCRSFSLPNLSQFNDKSMKLDSPLALNGIWPKRLFRSMVAISSQTSTYPLSIMYLLRPPYLTFVLKSFQKLEVSTPAILLNLQQQLRILLLLTPENHLACLEHVHKYLTDIDTYLLVKELITRKSLNDLHFELLKLTRLKHIERKKRMDNITMNTSSTLSSSSFISLDLQTLLPEDVLDKKILHIKEKLNQTILSYKCIQELLNHKDDFTFNITGDVDLVGSDTTTTTGSDTFLCYRSSDHDPQFYISHDKEQSQITISKNNEDPVFIADHSELDYALRLLHLRDTELLYIISTQNKSEEESMYSFKYNLSASILTSEVLKEKLKKFLYWENIDPININSIPIQRININMLELQESSEQQQQIDTISSVSKNQLFINIETTEITDQSTTGQMSYHEDMDWYEQHLYTLVQNALNALNQMNQHFLESKKPLLSECRQEELINILTKLLTTIPINCGIQQDPHEKTVPKIFPSSSFSFSPSLTSSSLLEEHQRCNTTATTMTPSGITLSSTTPTYNITTTATSFSQAKPISEISDSSNLSLTTNLTYPRRSEKTSIHELISSVDHLKNLKELRNLAKYLLDQYHIVTSELELQSDTNWCLRQRLTNANSQLNRLTGLLNKGSQGLSSIEEDLSLGTDKTSLRSEHYDGIRQRSLQPTYYNLNTLQEKHKTSGRRLNFIPSSDEHLVRSSYSSSIQTMGRKSILKSKSKSDVSSMTSRISDPDYFIIHGMFIPMKIMQSISSQTVKHKKLSCLPRNTFNCGPILKRSSIHQHSRKRYHSSTDYTNQSLSTSSCVNDQSINSRTITSTLTPTPRTPTPTSTTPTATVPTTTLTDSSKQLDNNNNPNIIISHWNELEEGQQKLHHASMSIIKDYEYYHNKSLSLSVSSTMNNDNDIQYNEKQSLLYEYQSNNNTTDNTTDNINSSNIHHQLPESSTSASTSSSLSYSSYHSNSHPHSYNSRMMMKSRKLKFHSRFLNLFKSNFKKS
ncbi:unnamed protein product [Schistosoma rodhaini]|nr:unnamed protein product [Schistosoma rodhaini]